MGVRNTAVTRTGRSVTWRQQPIGACPVSTLIGGGYDGCDDEVAMAALPGAAFVVRRALIHDAPARGGDVLCGSMAAFSGMRSTRR